MDTYKLYGDILMINAHLQVQYEPSIQLPNLLSEDGELLTIPLKPNLTIVENGQWYYKLYTKLKIVWSVVNINLMLVLQNLNISNQFYIVFH